MTPTSSGVHTFKKDVTRDMSLLQDPKIVSSMVSASSLNTNKESLYLESLYDNDLSPLEYGSSVNVRGDIASTLEVGLHVAATALEKQHWCCVVDPYARSSSLAIYEACTSSPRFVCVRNFSPTRFTTVLSHLVSVMHVVVAHVPTHISTQHMARIMSRVRENNSIIVFLDPARLCQSSDRQIVANTKSFQGIEEGWGVLLNRIMNIEEYKHGIKIPANKEQLKRYA